MARIVKPVADKADLSMSNENDQPKEKKRTGRPTIYTEKLGIEICEWIASGKSLNSYCKRKGTPSFKAVYKWLNNANKKPELDIFVQMYTRAREDSADTMIDKILDIADGERIKRGENKGDYKNQVDRDRLRVEARKFIAMKLKPRKYGNYQRSEMVDSNGKLVIPTVVILPSNNRDEPDGPQQ